MCKKCVERGKRMSKLDVNSFKAYFCYHFNDVVHDYDAYCPFHTLKEKVGFS